MDEFAPNCPLPLENGRCVMSAHGGGGTAMHRLLRDVFFPAFSNPLLDSGQDAAVLEIAGMQVAFTTDSFVVRPLFFPGGDIGSLAVYGTVNDLAMLGARPLHLSAGFILEEGLPLETVERVVRSMQAAAARTGVQIVTGDTKVIDRRQGDELLINTSGIGVIEAPAPLTPAAIQPGDAILVNGDIGRHGMAIMAAREGLEFETEILSDAAPLADLVLGLFEDGVAVHCLRDCTRGGVSSALNELATASGRHLHLVEGAVPVEDTVRGACELLGLDPLYVANEGRFVCFVAAKDADNALASLARRGAAPAIIGHVQDGGKAWVTLESALGATRILDMLSGEQLPRIC